jgi:sigma-B regulation protein RsbU (phosphoserine phosphatase)
MQTTPRHEPKLLYRRLDSLFSGLDPARPERQQLETFLERSFRTLGGDLKLRGALLYGERRDDYQLLNTAGDTGGGVAETLDPRSAPLQSTFRHRVYIFGDPDDPGSTHRAGWHARSPSAALLVGRRPHRYLLVVLMAEGWVLEELDFALNTIRASLGSRLADERVRGSLKQAARIQQSLLPEEPPSFPGFEIAFRSQPADEVGGDLYDFLAFGDEVLGIAIGDASGHGLPAALLVRDVVTGLRMGLERDLKVAHVFRKLNRVIHQSRLSSRFVSVFFGELERDGTLVYVNAGHQPPVLLGRQRVERLHTGGTVIGPLPEVDFRRGIARLDPGDVLVMCTDGILERRDRKGDFFGEERLLQVVRQRLAASAQEILDAALLAARNHGGRRPWDDDATLVVLKRIQGDGEVG